MHFNNAGLFHCFSSSSRQPNNLMVPGPRPANNSQFGNLISNYDSLPQFKKKEVMDIIQRNVVEKEDFLEKNMKQFFSKPRNNIVGINLIAGTTGSGKSTLFNYIHGFPLIIDRNPNRAGTAILKLDGRYIQNNPQRTYSPIGEGFVSKTSYPVFAMGEGKDYIDVDLPGQFDNKDFLQSIINALLRIRVCQLAPQMKLTIVVSYNQLSNRGTALKKTVGEIQKFIGSWKHFHTQAVFLVITQVPSQLNDPQRLMRNKLAEIANQQVYDLRQFTPILNSIIQREAFGVMPTPSLKVRPRLNRNHLLNQDEQQRQLEMILPVGDVYTPKKSVCSPQLINSKIASVEYMKIYEGLLCPGIKQESKRIVDDICLSLIEELKQGHVQVIKEMMKPVDKNHLAQVRNDIRLVSNFATLRRFFKIGQDFMKRTFKDLEYFLRLTNIKDVDQRLFCVKKDVDMFISQWINEMHQIDLEKQRQRERSQEKKRQRLDMLKQKRSRLRQLEDSIKRLTQYQLEDQQSRQSRRHKQDIKELKNQWFQAKDEISAQQDNNQKQRRSSLERFDGLRVQSDDEGLKHEDFKRKMKAVQKQKKKWKSYIKNKCSDHPIYNLVVRRRLRKIDDKQEKMQNIVEQKQETLQSLEESIQQLVESISQYKEDKRSTRNQNERNRCQYQIRKAKDEKKKLEEKWYQLKDQVSDLQDEQKKREKQQNYQCLDEDLSPHVHDKYLPYQELAEKVQRLRAKYSDLKLEKQEEKDNRINYLKIKRRLKKLKVRIKRCKHLLKKRPNNQSQDDSEEEEQDDDDEEEQEE